MHEIVREAMMMTLRRACDVYLSVKYLSLVMLVLQNTLLVVCMRSSRTASGPMYASSTAVVCMEIVKFITCLAVITHEKGGLVGLGQVLQLEIVQKPTDLILLGVPSLLYTVQNNLLYFALSHLDAATYQVGYQLKILTTAIFTVIMLKKSISRTQWLALVLLTIGVSLTQLNAHSTSNNHGNTMSGFVAVLLASCTSGFAGVYFEKVLKHSKPSLWVRNIQMGITSILLAFLGVFTSNDRVSVMNNGFFYGFNSLVIIVVLLQAIGGLVVAVVVNYADNILKGFASSFSIITSCILCYFVYDFQPTLLFALGAILVNVSMYVYSNNPIKEKDDKVQTKNETAENKV